LPKASARHGAVNQIFITIEDIHAARYIVAVPIAIGNGGKAPLRNATTQCSIPLRRECNSLLKALAGDKYWGDFNAHRETDAVVIDRDVDLLAPGQAKAIPYLLQYSRDDLASNESHWLADTIVFTVIAENHKRRDFSFRVFTEVNSGPVQLLDKNFYSYAKGPNDVPVLRRHPAFTVYANRDDLNESTAVDVAITDAEWGDDLTVDLRPEG
jgi:hypothetical protein